MKKRMLLKGLLYLYEEPGHLTKISRKGKRVKRKIVLKTQIILISKYHQNGYYSSFKLINEFIRIKFLCFVISVTKLYMLGKRG